MFADNNVLSKAFRGEDTENALLISSVAAGEFLDIYCGDHSTKANYYIPNLRGAIHGAMLEKGKLLPSLESPKGRHFTKNTTDQIILDFGNDYPQLIEYGSCALAKVINEKKYRLYLQSIQHLPKNTQKTLKKSIIFLFDKNYHCYPLTKQIIEISMYLLYEATKKYTFKDNFRNSINDLLILATAIKYSSTLKTNDGLLQKIIAELYSAPFQSLGGDLIINFGLDISRNNSFNHRESKGYINRGWHVSFNKGYF